MDPSQGLEAHEDQATEKKILPDPCADTWTKLGKTTIIPIQGLVPQYVLRANVLGFESVRLPVNCRWIIGRDPHCNIQFADPKISRTHCAISVHPDGTVAIQDLSRHGTKVNGARLELAREFQLNGGDIVILADTIVMDLLQVQ